MSPSSQMKAATFVSFLLLFSCGAWDYEHMDQWSDEFPMCARGIPDQSPIDIDTAHTILNPAICNSTFAWDIDFTQQSFQLRNNGWSLVMSPVQQVELEEYLFPDHYDYVSDENGYYVELNHNNNTIAKFPNYFKPNSSPHNTFCFDSVHFHWGLTDDTGSEHFVNGRQYPLEAHFVHYSCAWNTMGQYFSHVYDDDHDVSGDIKQLAVVSVFFDVLEDGTNPVFDTIFANDTLDRIVVPINGVIVNDLDLSQLIPENIASAGYYAYEGSITSPPCYNINRWHVMNARGYIGRSQLEMFRKLKTDYAEPIAPNYRDIQNNTNDVYSCGINPTSQPSSQPTKEPTVNIIMRHSDFVSTADDIQPPTTEQAQAPLSGWGVAIIASLGTAAVMGIVFVIIYKKQGSQIRKRADTNSFVATNQNNECIAPGAAGIHAVDMNQQDAPTLEAFAPSAPSLDDELNSNENSVTGRGEGEGRVTGMKFNHI